MRDARYLAPGLPHRRRDGRAHRQDLLLRGLREGRRDLPGARSSSPAARSSPERDALRAHLQRDRRPAPSASTWAATSSSPTRPVGMIKAVRAIVHERRHGRRRLRRSTWTRRQRAAPRLGGGAAYSDDAQGLADRRGPDSQCPRPCASRVYYSNADVRIEERPVPAIGPDEVLRAHPRLRHLRLRRAWSGTASPRRRSCSATRSPATSSRSARASPSSRVGDRVVVTPPRPVQRPAAAASPGDHTACDTLHTTNFDPGGFCRVRARARRCRRDRGVLVLPDSVELRRGHVRRAARLRRARPDSAPAYARVDRARRRQRHLGPAAHPARARARRRAGSSPPT